MIMITYTKGMSVSLLLLEDASIFFDYFTLGNDVCNTVYLSRNGYQIAVIRFDKGAEFIRVMGEI